MPPATRRIRSRRCWSPPAPFCWFGTVTGAHRATLAASGAAVAAAILVKPTNIVALPAFLLYLPILAWVRKKSVLRIESAVEAALLVAPVVASVMVMGWLNWLRFDSVFNSGYPGRMFGMPLGVGLYGLLFSVNKGLLFHAPLVLLAPVGLLIMRRDERADAALVTVTFLAYIAFTADDYWGGGWVWGPRYLLPMLPLLFVPVAKVAHRFALARRCAVVLAVAGLAFNSLGVIVNVEAYRATILNLWMPERTGLVQVGSSNSSRGVVPMAVPPEDVLLDFAPVLGHWWMLHVALAGCECDERTAACRCRGGRFDDRPAFLDAPWRRRHPEDRPARAVRHADHPAVDWPLVTPALGARFVSRRDAPERRRVAAVARTGVPGPGDRIISLF